MKKYNGNYITDVNKQYFKNFESENILSPIVYNELLQTLTVIFKNDTSKFITVSKKNNFDYHTVKYSGISIETFNNIITKFNSNVDDYINMIESISTIDTVTVS